MGEPVLSDVRSDGGAAGRRTADAPKLLFHYPVLNRGGAEKSLLRLLVGLADRGCEVHLVLTSPGGVLEPEVDSRIRIHHLRKIRVSGTQARNRMRRMLGLPVLAGRWAIARMQEFHQRRRLHGMRFDAAFTGLAGLSPDFICNVVDARKRFVFVRNDPVADRDGRWAANIRAFHARIDAYICVSRFVRDALATQFPEIAGKSTCVYNLLDAQAMRTKACEHPNPFGGDEGEIRVLSVCRLQEASKGLLRMVDVHRRLLDAGVRHVWHVLGDGPDRAMLERAIEEHGVSASFKLHGAIENPFPYYKHADICAVLSRYEGLCGVVNEARVLERPVIATRFSAIEEQIENGVNGLIVEQDVDAICKGMSALMRDASLRQRLATGGYAAALLDDGRKLDRIGELVRSGYPAPR